MVLIQLACFLGGVCVALLLAQVEYRARSALAARQPDPETRRRDLEYVISEFGRATPRQLSLLRECISQIAEARGAFISTSRDRSTTG